MSGIFEAAKKAANNLERMDFMCPRDVKNPGLYFGFMLGAKHTGFELRRDTEMFDDLAMPYVILMYKDKEILRWPEEVFNKEFS